MPAKSKSQQRLFGMVHAYQKGKLKHAPASVKRIAKHISKEDAEHFAKTRHEGLPETKKAEVITMTRYEQGFMKRAQELGVHVDDKYISRMRRKKALKTILKKTLMAGIGAGGGYLVGNGLGSLTKTVGGNVRYVVTKDGKAYKVNVPSDFNKSLGAIGAMAGGVYGAMS